MTARNIVLLICCLLCPGITSAADYEYNSYRADLEKIFSSYLQGESDSVAAERVYHQFTDTIAAADQQALSLAFLDITSYIYQKGGTAYSKLITDRIIQQFAGKEEYRTSKLLLRAYFQAAMNYENLGYSDQAIICYKKSIEIIKARNEPKLLARVYNNFFGIYYANKNYDQAIDLIEMAIEINTREKEYDELNNNYNNLSLVYYERADYDKALIYLDKAMQLTKSNDYLSRSLIYTNMGEVYFKQKLYSQAERNLQTALELQQKAPFNALTIHTKSNMALTKAHLHKNREAEEMKRSILRQLKKISSANMQLEVYEQLSEICFTLKDSIQGINYVMQHKALSDSLNDTSSKKQLMQLLIAYDTERLQQNNQKLQQSVKMYRLAAQNRNLIIYGAGTGVLLLVLFIAFLLNKMKTDKKNNRLINEQSLKLREYEQAEFERKKQTLTLELDHKNRQLTTYTIDLAANNEFHQKIYESLQQIKSEMTAQPEKSEKQISEIMFQLEHYNDKLLSEDFRTYFGEVHPMFLNNLAERFPGLSKKDLRLCAYIHLGLSTKEIAALTFREIRSIESSRNRLRKKMDVPAETSIQSFLSELNSK